MKRSALLVVVLAAALLTLLPRQSVDAATCRPMLTTVSVSPASVPGGASSKVTVTLSCKATSALTVHLAGFKGITVPSAISVKRGKNGAEAKILTSVRSRSEHGDIEGTLGRTHRKARLTVTKTPRSCRTPRLTGFRFPKLTYVGDQLAATIGLSCAPTAPIRLRLRSSNSDLPVPGTITVGRYYDYAVVPLDPKADETGQYSATLAVSYNREAISGMITVDPGLSLFEIPPCSEPNCVEPNGLFTGVVPAGGLTVQVASNNPAIVVPATFTAAAGSLGGTFFVTVNPVTTNTKVTLTATFGGRTLRATTTLLPPFGPGDSVTLSAENGPGPIYGQEFDLEYIVLLSNPAPVSGETVTFSATDPSIELQTTSTNIPSGFDDGYVDINTADITSPVHAELEATVAGITATLPITIEPGLASVTVPATVTGGDPFTGTVSLAGPVDTPTTVELQSTGGIVTVPVTVTIPTGQSSVSFTATTFSVTSDSAATIIAMLGSTEVSSNEVTLTPPP
jgi:hypothetical protein